MAQSQKQRFWQTHIRAWQDSGLSQVAYCQANQLSVSSFGYWRRRGRASASSPPAVIPVVRESAVGGMQLRSPGGWQIVLPPSLGVDVLRAVLAALP